MDVEQIADGLWRWTTPHPEWTPDSDWDGDVGCLYYEGPEAVVLIDPLVPAEPDERERFLRALDRDLEAARRPLAVVLTVFWHERSAQELVERHDAELWAHEPALDRLSARVSNPFTLGDALPGEIQAFDADRRDEVLLWIPQHEALVAGDVLLGDGRGGVRVCPDDWLPEGVSPDEFRAALRPLLELPVERLLVSHGDPVLTGGRDALARALG